MHGNDYFTDTELELLHAKDFKAGYFGDLKAGDVVALTPTTTYPTRENPNSGVYSLYLIESRTDGKRGDIKYVGVTRVEHDTECDFDEDDVAVNVRKRVRFIGHDEKGIERHYDKQAAAGC